MTAHDAARAAPSTGNGAADAGRTSGRDLDSAGVLARWPTLIALVVMWIALWGDLSIANLLSGTVVAFAVMLLAGRVEPRPVQHFHLAAALRYVVTFGRQLLIASYEVALAVVRPDRVHPGIIAMPLSYASDAVLTLVANSITLTPGTLTLEAERRGDIAILYVHTLDLSDPDSVRADICELEKLAVDAFAGTDAQVVQARTLAEYEEAEQHPAWQQSAEQQATRRRGDPAGDGAVRTQHQQGKETS